MGYIWNYPVYVPIVIPWPGDELLPDDLDPIPPEALLPSEIDELPEALAPDVVLPADVDFPDAAPELDLEPLAIEPVQMPEDSMAIEPALEQAAEPQWDPPPEPIEPGFGDDFGSDDFGGGGFDGDFGGGDFGDF